MWDISDLDAPVIQNVYYSVENAIDHNQYSIFIPSMPNHLRCFQTEIMAFGKLNIFNITL